MFLPPAWPPSFSFTSRRAEVWKTRFLLKSRCPVTELLCSSCQFDVSHPLGSQWPLSGRLVYTPCHCRCSAGHFLWHCGVTNSAEVWLKSDRQSAAAQLFGVISSLPSQKGILVAICQDRDICGNLHGQSHGSIGLSSVESKVRAWVLSCTYSSLSTDHLVVVILICSEMVRLSPSWALKTCLCTQRLSIHGTKSRGLDLTLSH